MRKDTVRFRVQVQRRPGGGRVARAARPADAPVRPIPRSLSPVCLSPVPCTLPLALHKGGGGTAAEALDMGRDAADG